MTPYEVASNSCRALDLPCHVNQRVWNSCFLASCDVVSDVCRTLVSGFFANGEIGPGAAGETSGADIHRSGMMGFTSVFGVVAPLGPTPPPSVANAADAAAAAAAAGAAAGAGEAGGAGAGEGEEGGGDGDMEEEDVDGKHTRCRIM